jgi:hypothetical protein
MRPSVERSRIAADGHVIPDARSAIRDLDALERRKVPDSRWRGFRDDGAVFQKIVLDRPRTTS